MIFASIKEGFALANRNLTLVAVRVAVALISLLTVIFFVGVPVIVGILYLGFDINRIQELLPSVAVDPLSFFAHYAGLLALLGVSLLIYLTLISIIWLYTVSGVLGVLRESAREPGRKFGLSDFFRAASTDFGRLLRVLSLVLLIVIAALTGSAAMSLVSVFLFHSNGGGSVFVIFMRTFVSVFALVMAVVAGIAGFVITIFSMVITVVDGSGAAESIKRTFAFIGQRPSAVMFPLILWIVLAFVHGAFYMVQSVLHFIPVVGTLLNIGAYFINLVFQSYISVALWGMLLAFYLNSTKPSIS
jgi:hypothetical protein